MGVGEQLTSGWQRGMSGNAASDGRNPDAFQLFPDLRQASQPKASTAQVNPPYELCSRPTSLPAYQALGGLGRAYISNQISSAFAAMSISRASLAAALVGACFSSFHELSACPGIGQVLTV